MVRFEQLSALLSEADTIALKAKQLESETFELTQ